MNRFSISKLVYCVHLFCVSMGRVKFLAKKFQKFLSWKDSVSKLLTLNGMKNLCVLNSHDGICHLSAPLWLVT